MPASKSTAKKISPALTEELTNYFATHDAARLSRNLRCMLLDYLAYELRTGVPLYIDELLWQLHDLFELLDVVEEETKAWHPQEKAG